VLHLLDHVLHPVLFVLGDLLHVGEVELRLLHVLSVRQDRSQHQAPPALDELLLQIPVDDQAGQTLDDVFGLLLPPTQLCHFVCYVLLELLLLDRSGGVELVLLLDHQGRERLPSFADSLHALVVELELASGRVHFRNSGC